MKTCDCDRSSETETEIPEKLPKSSHMNDVVKEGFGISNIKSKSKAEIFQVHF